MSDQRAFAPNFHKTISHPAWRDVCALFAAYDALEGVVDADDVRAYLLDKATTRLRGADMVAQASGLCGAATSGRLPPDQVRGRLRGKPIRGQCHAPSQGRADTKCRPGAPARHIFTNLFHNLSRTQALAKHESDKQQACNVINEIQVGHRHIGALLAEAKGILS